MNRTHEGSRVVCRPSGFEWISTENPNSDKSKPGKETTFIGEPTVTGSRLHFLGREFVSKSLGELAGVAAANAPILSALFAEHKFADDVLWIQSDALEDEVSGTTIEMRQRLGSDRNGRDVIMLKRDGIQKKDAKGAGEKDGAEAQWLEIRSRPGPSGFVQCFTMDLAGRRLYRSCFFSSDFTRSICSVVRHSLSIALPPPFLDVSLSLGRKTQPFDCLSTASPGRLTAVAPPSLQVPSKDDRTGQGRDSDPLPEIIQDSAGGRLWSAEIVPSSIIFHRSTGRGKPAETFISPAQLRGLLPDAIVDEFSFWAPMTRARKGHTNSRLAELSIVGEPMEHSRSDYTLEVRLSLSAGSGAYDADVVQTDPDGSTMFLLDLSRAPSNDLLGAVVEKFRAFEPLSHVLAWTDARPNPLDKCELKLIELPRLGLKFEPALDTVDDVSCWRLYSSDFSGWFVSDFCVGDSEIVATHLVGLPHALILENLNGELRFVVPNVDLVRPRIKHAPFSTAVVLDRHSSAWLGMGRLYYMYDVHISSTFISCDVATALYLCLARLLAREYEAVVPLLRSLKTDIPFTLSEGHLIDQILAVSSPHPSAAALIHTIYKLAVQNGHPEIKPTKETKPPAPMAETQHVHCLCRDSESDPEGTKWSRSDSPLGVPIDGRDACDREQNVPRASMTGGLNGLYGYLGSVRQRVGQMGPSGIEGIGSMVWSDIDPYHWKEIRDAGPERQMAIMADCLGTRPKQEACIHAYWTLVSGLRMESGGPGGKVQRRSFHYLDSRHHLLTHDFTAFICGIAF